MPASDTRDRLLDAALALIRRGGLASTSVADLCAEAGLSKGAFFHHFASKEALALAATHHWDRVTGALFDAAEYGRHADPLDRLMGYLALRRAILDGPLPEVTCLLGTMVQEAYVTAPAIRDAARDSILAHAARVARDIEAARALYSPDAAWDAEGLSLHVQAVLQGSFILAKATGDVAVAQASLDHLAAYLRHLFHIDPSQEDRT